ncbi:MAG: ABC transporter ATP-binding protein [Oxalicibacterium faecigallinarum]|uniref:ABC transporter ATP-binding protein n=1 Tax=Oxalicibacterium faecigallinarum TaxID=573741 RepID=UPI002807F0EC|nr:ABC transporter ATP-binding protein [Oxalicibacterium faecigallinarum]MDQ7968828.1 ABC transporter ATP-binding protein [Oxalicibacterium faecigallinarum]
MNRREHAPVIALSQVGKRFGKTVILHDVSLQVNKGERLALIGPNGAGKSTLFNLISGRLTMSDGDIELHGQSIRNCKPNQIHRRGLARSFQITSVFPKLSVAENLQCAVLWSHSYKYSFWHRVSKLRDVHIRVDQVMEEIGLAARRDVAAAALSYAEQRALEIGITIAGDADVILLDEPTAGMSRSESEAAIALIRKVTTNKTLLMVEHDMSVVFELADRIAVLADGALLACDTPAAIRANAQVQKAYLGALLGEKA